MERSPRRPLGGGHGTTANRSCPVTGVLGDEEARLAVHAMPDAPEPPTGIFPAQNRSLVGAVRALHERGVQHDVAMVGSDDVELLDLLNPGVTVVAQDPHRLGELAAERLLARMAASRSNWRRSWSRRNSSSADQLSSSTKPLPRRPSP